MASDPEELQREIERTRADLAETIDAISERVSPRRVADRGRERIRQIFDDVRSGRVQLHQSRVAAAGGGLAAVSVLLLVMRRRRRRRRRAERKAWLAALKDR